MTLGAPIADVRATCESLIAAHADREGIGDCEECGQEYPCSVRLLAEAVVDALAKLARLDAPGHDRGRASAPQEGVPRMKIVETGDGWRTSSFSGESGNCVQVKAAGGAYAIRDSKCPDGPILIFTTAEFTAFKTGVAAGEFDF